MYSTCWRCNDVLSPTYPMCFIEVDRSETGIKYNDDISVSTRDGKDDLQIWLTVRKKEKKHTVV